MTALSLFVAIVFGLLLQVAVFSGMAFYRHWLIFQEMKHRLANLDTETPSHHPPATNQKPTLDGSTSQTTGYFLEEGESPIVLIAGESGITHMISMINQSLHQNPTRELWLFQGFTNSDEHVMKGRLETLAKQYPHFHLHTSYSRPLPKDLPGIDYHQKGHIGITLLRMTLSLKPYRFHIYGPQSMIDTLVPALKGWGVPDEHLRCELFGPATVSRPQPIRTSKQSPTTDTKEITVTFSLSGKTVAWNDDIPSLLQLAERNAIKVDSGCRAGACGICQTTILEGEVIYSRPPDSKPEPGQCHLCITKPKTNLTLQA